MPLVTDPFEALEIYEAARRAGMAVPAFCAENTLTMEAILAGAESVAREMDIDGLPVVVAVTAAYHSRRQLKNYTPADDIVEGMKAFKSDLLRLAGPDGRYGRLRVMAHLDHAQPGLDDELIEREADFWASVMYDCSTLSLEENERLTAQFAARMGSRVLVEGAVDEIKEDDAGYLTTAEAALRFRRAAKASLLVVNVGTEHRRTSGRAVYHAERAREIRDAAGACLVLHGASSLAPEELAGLPADGFVKVNIWTILEMTGARAVVRDILENLGRLLTAAELRELARRGIIGEGEPARWPEAGPSLACLSQLHRNHEVWFPAVTDLVADFYRRLGCAGPGMPGPGAEARR